MSMPLSQVEERVRKVIVESLCCEPQQVQRNTFLIKDLGAESIDFLDIVFRLEKEFNIQIPHGEIEQMARGGIPPEEFELEGILQPQGIKRLQQLVPEIPAEAWVPGMSLRQLPQLFTVAVFIGIVERKLDGSLFGEMPVAAMEGRPPVQPHL